MLKKRKKKESNQCESKAETDFTSILTSALIPDILVYNHLLIITIANLGSV